MEKQLEQLKEKYTIDWHEFKLQDLFEKIPTKKLPYKAQDLKDIHNNVYCLPALTAGVFNQGLAYYVPREGATILKNVISVSANGANTGVMYYQPREFTVLQDSYAIKYIYKELKYQHYTYFVAALQKSIHGRYDWSNKAGWERIRTEKIKLPVSSDGQIAFDYIEEAVNIIEAERLTTLKGYFERTGLENVELSEAELKSIQNLDITSDKGRIEWREFKLIDIFTIKNTHCILSRDVVENSGDFPYLTASRNNNSIGTYVNHDKAKIDEGNSIFIGGKTFVVTYQEKDYFSNDSHNLALYYKDDEMRTKENQLFMVSSINKGLGHLYSWGDSISKAKIQKDKILLPVKGDNTPDFEFMTTVIMATQKLILKNVIEWLEKRIKNV